MPCSTTCPATQNGPAANGEQWNIPKLLKAEIESPIHGATCGGSHRLFGIANAVKERVKRGEPIDGEWARAAKYTADYQRYTLGTLQNPDGSFSTEWFNYPADRAGDVDRKIQTTGHMLEWLVWSLPEDELRDPKVLKAVEFVSVEPDGQSQSRLEHRSLGTCVALAGDFPPTDV